MRTCYSVGIFTLQRGLGLSLPVAPIFSPRHSSKSITLQRDVEANVFSEAHFFCSLGFGIKGFKLGHLEEKKSLGGGERGAARGGKQEKIL